MSSGTPAGLMETERHDLEQSAAMLEAIVEANPEDVGALEGLRDIYGRLGEAEKVETTSARLAAVTRSRGAGATAVAPASPAPSARAARPTRPALAGPAPADRARFRHLSPLASLLLAAGVISPNQIEQAITEQRSTHEKFGRVLVRLGFLSETDLVGFLSRHYGIPSITLDQLEVAPDLLRMVPAEVARKHDVLPVSRTRNTLTLAVADPTHVDALDDVRFMTALQVVPVVAAPTDLRAAIDRHYPRGASGAEAPIAEILTEMAEQEVEVLENAAEAIDVFELRESADDAPVVRLVNMVLVDAIRRGSSDIHWEPYEKEFRVRFRIDGVLYEILTLPKRLEPAILSRVKIMASLDIAERRMPQDGRIKIRYGEREIDFRVSVMPTIFGEKAVLRILDKESLKLDLTSLGFDPGSLAEFERAIRQPYGMVLITGPTGSGKTTTLYSAIHTLNAPNVNIMTAEDPVEYNLRGVNQVQVNEGIGRTFAAALRSFLRQDPDVILVGETRDLETAQISIRAALTGHLVFSTLHTNDSPSTVARLLDMGIPAFLVSSSLLLVVAQRLARRICPGCRTPYELPEEALVPHGHSPSGSGRVTLYKGAGCNACGNTGLRGRVAIYEVMPITDELRHMILANASTAELRATAQSHGMRSLRQAGIATALEGMTTLEEVLRVTLG